MPVLTPAAHGSLRAGDLARSQGALLGSTQNVSLTCVLQRSKGCRDDH